MVAVLRGIFSIIVGVVVAFLLLVAIEAASDVIHPLPADFNGTKEEMCKHVARYPHWVLALVVVAWSGTAFVSTWITRRIGNLGCGIFIGFLLWAALAFNVAMLTYSIWFEVVILFAVPASIFLGLHLARPRKSVSISNPL